MPRECSTQLTPRAAVSAPRSSARCRLNFVKFRSCEDPHRRSGYDSNWFRTALKERGTEPCIPPTKSRKTPLHYAKALYRTRHKIENLFAKLKDWRRIATRYDRCAHTFFSAVCIAATVAFYLNQ